jgi:hypothetical protein
MAYIFHEKLDLGESAKNCLNNLLQGPRFKDSHIEKLNAKYSRISSDTSGKNFHFGHVHPNVLKNALKKHKIELIDGSSDDGMLLILDECPDQAGFIIHSRHHWLAVRKIEGYWWNLDSHLRRPKLIEEDVISDFCQDKEQDEETSIYICRLVGVDDDEQFLPQVEGDDLNEDELANSQLYHNLDHCVMEDSLSMFEVITLHDPKGGLAEELGIVPTAHTLQLWYRDRERMVCEFEWVNVLEIEELGTGNDESATSAAGNSEVDAKSEIDNAELDEEDAEPTNIQFRVHHAGIFIFACDESELLAQVCKDRKIASLFGWDFQDTTLYLCFTASQPKTLKKKKEAPRGGWLLAHDERSKSCAC